MRKTQTAEEAMRRGYLYACNGSEADYCGRPYKSLIMADRHARQFEGHRILPLELWLAAESGDETFAATMTEVASLLESAGAKPDEVTIA